MSVGNDIRAALEQEIANVSGVPASSQRAWENARFEPTTGTTWLRMRLQPTETRPATRGDSPQIRHQGLFLVDVFAPADEGPASAETLADAIRDRYTVSKVLTENSTNVRFDYAERGQGVIDHPWYMVPVAIAWYAYE